MGIFTLGSAVGAIVDVLEDLNLDKAEIDAVVRTLNDGSADLGDDSFHRTAKIAPASFGGSDTARALGAHHERAYMVMDDTLRGVVRDLERFRDSVRNAEQLVTRADETAAGDLNVRRQRVADAMTYVSHNSAGDHANHEARNHQVGGGDH
jgi:hypothetical protein